MLCGVGHSKQYKNIRPKSYVHVQRMCNGIAFYKYATHYIGRHGESSVLDELFLFGEFVRSFDINFSSGG